MSKKQLNVHTRVFSLLFVSSTLSLNKLHRITLTENSHLNKILISRALLRQEKTGYFLLLSNGRLAFGKAKSFSRAFVVLAGSLLIRLAFGMPPNTKWLEILSCQAMTVAKH